MKRNPYENDLAGLRRDYGFSKDFMRSTRRPPKTTRRVTVTFTSEDGSKRTTKRTFASYGKALSFVNAWMFVGGFMRFAFDIDEAQRSDKTIKDDGQTVFNSVYAELYPNEWDEMSE